MSLKVCRGCLASTGKLERIKELSRKVFFTICGLSVSPDDKYPQYLCTECSHQLRKALAFRRKTRRAHFVLKEVMMTKKEITAKDLKQVDRKSSNLISSWDVWQPNSCAVYSVALPEEQAESTENIDPQVMTDIERAKQESLQTLNFGLDRAPTIRQYARPTNALALEDFTNVLSEDKVKTGPGDLIRDTPEIKSNTTILVDIKPANYKEIERLEEERRKDERRREEEEALRQIAEEDDNFHDDGDTGNDYVDPATIDLNDVFKGLEEKEMEDSDDGLSEMKIEISRKKRKNIDLPAAAIPKRGRVAVPKKVLELYDSDITFICRNPMLLDNLSAAKIRLLDTQEQIAGFKKRLEQEPYKSATFRCAMCVIKLGDKNALLLHLDRKHKYTAEKCNVCLARFKDEQQLEIHKSWEHRYEYTCLCDRVWYCYQDLIACCSRHPMPCGLSHDPALQRRAHELNQRLQDGFIKVLVRPDQWEKTMKSIKLISQRQYSCLECGADCYTENTLQQHYKQHGKPAAPQPQTRAYGIPVKQKPTPLPSKAQCSVCDSWFYNKEAVAFHFRNNHAFMFKCRNCHKMCDRIEALLHSCRSKLAQSAHHCVGCGQVYGRASDLLLHQLMQYEMIRPNDSRVGLYTCSLCDTHFINQQAYDKHQTLVHTELKTNTIHCNTCKKLFRNEKERDLHQAACVKTTYPVKCLYCEEIMTNKWQQRKHERQLHRDVLDPSTMVICESCGAIFSKTSYKSHKEKCASKLLSSKPDVTGTGLQGLLYCDICQRPCSKPKDYVIHMLRNHIPKPYCCTLCDLRFDHRSDVKVHILKIHAPVKPYQCEVCHVHFSCQEYYGLHRKKVHGISPDKIAHMKKMSKMKSITRKYMIVYEHMRVVGRHIPVEIIENCELMYSDYLEEKITPVPRESVKEFFDFDVDAELHTTIPKLPKPPQKKRIRIRNTKKSRKYPPCSDSEQETTQAGLEDDNVFEDISYVKSQDGGFTLKTEASISPSKSKKPKFGWENAFDNTVDSVETKYNVNYNDKDIARSAFGTDAEFLDVKNKNITNANEEKPVRLEIEADELASKYEVVELDGVQYVNIDGVLYKIEYS